MNIGFIGLGKLGLPCALAIDPVKKHNVMGFDVDSNVNEYLINRKIPYREEGAHKLLETHDISFDSSENVIKNSDIIFLPIQTPHDEMYEGVTRIPDSRVDFDYSFLKEGVKEVSDILDDLKEEKIIVIISTVLPGTIDREIKPILSKYAKLCYNPFFIAMGTTINDFMNPEFVLMGVDDKEAASTLKEFYSTLHSKDVFECSINEAELIKVSYNTFITMKICLANTVTELSHKLTNIDSDKVMGALKISNQRLISSKYLDGGMGDGGGCHPRDNIALSWLSREVDLSYDWYENLMISREKHTEWLVDLTINKAEENNLDICILGKSFKKETNLTVGSPSLLFDSILREKGFAAELYDPHIDSKEPPTDIAKVYFIATNHDTFKDYNFPKDSIVIDPWRIITSNKNIELVSIGRS
jgi:UDPglucose 6-dehydrogenase